MGYYINEINGKLLPRSGKIEALLKEGATRTSAQWRDNLVCVVDNGMFEAAGYCFCEEEFKVFAENDGRRKTWLIVPNAKEIAK